MRRPPRLPLRLRLPAREPWFVLVPLLAGQWIALGIFVLVVRHNGWLFYQGGDQTFFYTSAWVVAGGHIPKAAIGYGWSYLLSPIAGAVGPNFLAALPVLVLLQTVVLVPLALYCVYGIARSFGGRALGYLAAALWVAAPFCAIPLWDHSYHAKYVEQFLPQALGMTALGDFPSMVCLLVAGLFCVRVLDTGDAGDAVLAAAAAGFAIGIKPANALFLAGPALAFVAARRFRELVSFGVALLPFLLALALWKYRGLGQLPILRSASDAHRLLAAGVGPPPAAFPGTRYLHLDWSQLRKNYVDLRELFWGVPLLQSLPLLGFLAAVRRSPPKALLLGGWLAAFVLVKGSSDQASIDGGTLLRLFMPGFPPLLILTALLPLLVRSRLSEVAPVPVVRVRGRIAAIVVAVFGVVPLLLFAAMPPLRSRTVVTYFGEDVMVSAEKTFALGVRGTDGVAVLSWPAQDAPGVRVFYRVFRSRPVVRAPDPALPPGREGIRCHKRPSGGYAGAVDCALEMSLLGETRSNRFVDAPPAGPWVYRVGVAANWRDDPSLGDVMVVSAPARQ